MPKELKTLEDRIDWLAEEILVLKENIGDLSGRLTTLETGEVMPRITAAPKKPHAVHDDVHPSDLEPEEGAWSRMGQEVLLPRVAAVCFMMVVALILRTITDNGMVNQQVGSYAGTAYAVGLVAFGWFLYGRKSAIAPVFPICGALLLFAIVFETHQHFESISSTVVYTVLILAQFIIVTIGIRCRAAALLFVATLGSTAVGIAIDFPKTLFACVGILLLINNIAAYVAARKKVTTSLRWYALFFSIVFWMLWAYKINYALKFRPENTLELNLPFALPVLLLFYAFYLYDSVRETLSTGLELDGFHNVLPVISSGGGFFALYAIASPWFGKEALLGIFAVALSALYILFVTWMARREEQDVPGGKEFVTAASVLLIQGLAVSLPALYALPVWCAAAMVLTLRADQWQSGGIRVISYLFQSFIFFFALKQGAFEIGYTPLFLSMIVAAFLSICCLWLYAWCRRHPPRYDSAFYSIFDRGDYTAALLLYFGTGYAFIFLRTLAFALLGGESAQASAVICAQSVILNGGAVALMIIGLKTRSREILITSGLIVLIAAAKVFIFDLFRTTGVPLVVSVFSFGVLAAVSSIVMRKWGQYHRETKHNEVRADDAAPDAEQVPVTEAVSR